MPIDYSEYPDNWKTEIRPSILERANNCCEWCGAPDRELIQRSVNGEIYVTAECLEQDYGGIDVAGRMQYEMPEQPIWQDKWVKVILTIAHLDHDTMNNDPSNLRALCQKCHLTYDAKHHAKNAAKTRRRKHEQETGQMRMFE